MNNLLQANLQAVADAGQLRLKAAGTFFPVDAERLVAVLQQIHRDLDATALRARYVGRFQVEVEGRQWISLRSNGSTHGQAKSPAGCDGAFRYYDPIEPSSWCERIVAKPVTRSAIRVLAFRAARPGIRETNSTERFRADYAVRHTIWLPRMDRSCWILGTTILASS